MRDFYYSFPTVIVSGAGTRDIFCANLDEFRGKKAFILTGLSSSKLNGSLGELLTIFRELDITYLLEDTCKPNPQCNYVIDVSTRAASFDPSVIFALGGGAVIDTAKAVSLMLANPALNSIWDIKEKTIHCDNAVLPIVAIPTSIGTGSEGNGSFAIYKDSSLEKFVFFNLSVRPKIAWLNPSFVSSLPSIVLQNSLIDVLAHFLEQYLTKEDFLWCDDALIGFMRTTIESYHHIDIWSNSESFRNQIQLLSTISMSYLLAQGKRVSWGLHHYVDNLADSRGMSHSTAIRNFITEWFYSEIVQSAFNDKLEEIRFVSDFLSNLSRDAYRDSIK